MGNCGLRLGIPQVPKDGEADAIDPRCHSVQPLDQPVLSEDTVFLIHITLNSSRQAVLFLNMTCSSTVMCEGINPGWPGIRNAKASHESSQYNKSE